MSIRLGVYVPKRAELRFRDNHSPATIAREIEALGFQSAWVFDSIGRGTVHDPLATLAVVASVSNLEIGTGILQVPLRNPVELASRLLSLHILSEGRLTVGVGAGSTPGDFAAVGADFDGRFAALRTSVEMMRSLWDGDAVGAAKLGLWPGMVGGPPIVVGTWRSPRWIARAAQDYDGWISSVRHSGWAAMQEGMALFRRLGGRRAIAANLRLDSRRTASGRTPDQFDFKDALAPSEARQAIARLAEIGFDDVVVRCVAGDHEELALAASLRP